MWPLSLTEAASSRCLSCPGNDAYLGWDSRPLEPCLRLSPPGCVSPGQSLTLSSLLFLGVAVGCCRCAPDLSDPCLRCSAGHLPHGTACPPRGRSAPAPTARASPTTGSPAPLASPLSLPATPHWPLRSSTCLVRNPSQRPGPAQPEGGPHSRPGGQELPSASRGVDGGGRRVLLQLRGSRAPGSTPRQRFAEHPQEQCTPCPAPGPPPPASLTAHSTGVSAAQLRGTPRVPPPPALSRACAAASGSAGPLALRGETPGTGPGPLGPSSELVPDFASSVRSHLRPSPVSLNPVSVCPLLLCFPGQSPLPPHWLLLVARPGPQPG